MFDIFSLIVNGPSRRTSSFFLGCPELIFFMSNFEANCGPRSEMITFGNPSCRKMLSLYSLAIPSESMVSLHGIK